MTELIAGCLYRLTGDKEGGHHNSYALINDRREIMLFDGIMPQAIPAISAILGINNLIGVILTHRHIPAIVGREGIEEWRARFGKDVPFFLSISEASHRSAMEALPLYDKYIDPVNNRILTEFGIETIPFPGHTQGSCLFYHQDKQMIFTGDCATGPGGTFRSGQDKWVRPPNNLSEDDERLRSNWKNFLKSSGGQFFGGRSVRSVIPGHGECIIDQDQDHIDQLLLNLTTDQLTPNLNVSSMRSE